MALSANANRLRVHQAASSLAVDVVHMSRLFRGPAALARADQAVRAALSIASNIAEACGRGTVAEFRQFLRYARGSAGELRVQLEIARKLDPKNERVIRTLESRTTLIVKMLNRLERCPPPVR